jgi:hypothetical protein
VRHEYHRATVACATPHAPRCAFGARAGARDAVAARGAAL